MKLFAFLLFSIILTLPCHALVSANKLNTFSIEELQEDFIYWKDRLVGTNPILYLYNTKKEFNRHFDSLYQEIDHPMTQLEFFQLIAPTTGYLKEGHTQIHEDEKSSENIIPLNIGWFNDTAFISYNYTKEKQLATGT